jgi:hypothetical protein
MPDQPNRDDERSTADEPERVRGIGEDEDEFEETEDLDETDEEEEQEGSF